MNDEIDDLKREYRQIAAPPHLATRIRAEVSEQPVRRHGWMPVVATMSVAIVAVWILPYLAGQQAVPTTPTKPSLSAIASLTPAKPPVSAPNLSQLRSVTVPKLPPKPRLTPAKPQSNYQFENELLEEKDHANS